MKAKTIAVMALLGEISAIKINAKREFKFENDEADEYMAESIKEAEAEY